MAFDTMRQYLTPTEDQPIEAKDTSMEPSDLVRSLLRRRTRIEDTVEPAPAPAPVEAAAVATAPARGPRQPVAPSYTLEDIPPALRPRAPLPPPSYTQERIPQPGRPSSLRPPPVSPVEDLEPSATSVTSLIPVQRASTTSDATGVQAGVVKPTTSPAPAAPADTGAKAGMPAPMTEGAGGDVDRLAMGQALIRALETSGSAIAGRDLRSGAAEALSERMKQVEALRAKREERGMELAQEKANNRAQVDYLISRFPNRKDSLVKLYDVAGKPNFPQLVRIEEQLALDAAKTQQTKAKTEDIAKVADYREGVLGLRRDSLEATRQWRAVQAGFRAAELALKQAEAARKREGSSEPSTKEQTAFRTAIKPANNTAVALKDAAGLDTASEGMLRTGKPPSWLSRGDIALFVSGDLGRSRLANTNPKAFNLLTEMARLKTMVGHEYFGSALSPAEAERQRQFLDFGLMDSPESLAKKMKTYHKTLGDKASVWIKPLIRNPLGQEWLSETGLDQVSSPQGSFPGLFEAPVKPAPTPTSTAPAPTGAAPTPAAAAGPATITIQRKSDGKTKVVPAADRAKWLSNPDFQEVK